MIQVWLLKLSVSSRRQVWSSTTFQAKLSIDGRPIVEGSEMETVINVE